MRIQHNITAMNSYRNYNNNTRSLGKNLEKLSSGYRINRAGDDAAGLAISEKMRSQITGLDAASKNVKDGISLVQTAEGAMQEVHDMLGRMKYLATQSSNGTYQNEVDRENLQKEVESLSKEIDRIADSANFNGQKLLDGSLGGNASKVSLGGNVKSTKQEALAGSCTIAISISSVGTGLLSEGMSWSATIGLSDGRSHTVTLTAKTGASGKVDSLVNSAGDVVVTLAKASEADTKEILSGLTSELQKSPLGKEFTINATTGNKGITFTNLEKGTKAAQVGAVGFASAGGQIAATLAVTSGVDEGRVIGNSSDVTLFDGSNFDDAVFTINGKKFIAVSSGANALQNGGFNLGKDVTVLVGSHASDLAAIEKATGLKASLTGSNALVLTAGTTGHGLQLQIGDTSDKFNQMEVKVADLHTDALGLKGLDISTADGANAAIEVIKDAINKVSSTRGDLGALQNRLEHTSNNLSVMTENIQDAESSIRDTDVANEMMKYTKNNILVQSAQAMLAQANQLPQGVLQLLQ